MFHKHSILDRKVRPGSYRSNLETQDKQYEAEQAKLKGKKEIQNEHEERVRRCYDPTDQEKASGEQQTFSYMQEALAVKEQQRREEEEERKRVVEYDQGYRNYTNGALPWLERANPFSGSEEYERYLKKEYMRGLLEDNLRLEYEKKSFQQYTTEASKEEDKDLMAQKNFWNKDSDKDKWWYKAGGGYHKGVGEYSTTIGHQIHHFAYNKWMDDEPKVPLSSYDSTAQRTWADPEQVAAATVRPATASSAYPWATHE